MVFWFVLFVEIIFRYVFGELVYFYVDVVLLGGIGVVSDLGFVGVFILFGGVVYVVDDFFFWFFGFGGSFFVFFGVVGLFFWWFDELVELFVGFVLVFCCFDGVVGFWV